MSKSVFLVLRAVLRYLVRRDEGTRGHLAVISDIGAGSHHNYYAADAAPRFIDVLYARSAGKTIFPAWSEAHALITERNLKDARMP